VAIRTYRPGDEAAQVSIYNEAGAELPKFKPATLDEQRRRSRGHDFDPTTRLYAVEGDTPVAYAAFHANGRVGYPWCRKGHEGQAESLFRAELDALRARGVSKAFAAYRGDWPIQEAFFLSHGFRKAREMVNFVMPMSEMPTPAIRRATSITPLQPRDIPALISIAPSALRTVVPAELEKHFFENPYFAPEALFAVRSPATGAPLAVGIAIYASGYSDPYQVDSAMPCFRLGAFGTEGMGAKRINGLFSFLAPTGETSQCGLDLLTHAAYVLHDTPCSSFAAQVPSDVGHLLRFYEHYFRRQASFPVFELEM
jgi:hypothetical protein